MKAYICNSCGNQTESKDSDYNLPPIGWYTVSKRGTYKTQDLCSVECLLTYTTNEVNDATAPAMPPAALPAVDPGSKPEVANG